MIELNDWLSIDKVSGEGNSEITLTALPCGVTEEKNTSLKIKTSTKEVILNLTQKYFQQVEKFYRRQKELISSEWQGCTKTLLVYTSEEDLYVEKAPEWVDVSVNREGFLSTYTITFKPNTSNKKRFGELVLRTFSKIHPPIKLVQGTEAEENKVIYYLSHASNLVPPPNVTTGLISYAKEWTSSDYKSIGCLYYDSPVINVVDNLFNGVTDVAAISFPPSVESIGRYACADTLCNSVDFSDNITSIGDYAFFLCNYFLHDFGILELPKNLETIGLNAFYYCTSISEIVFPSSLHTIGQNAFYYCSSLNKLNIPDNVTTIGSGAFAMCEDLTSFVIGSGVNSLGSEVLSGCIKLSSIVISENNTTYDSRNNCNCIIETATDKVLVGCMNSVIPDTIKIIGEGAFRSVNIKNITLPNSLTRIEDSAFAASKLTSIVIPNNVTVLKNRAFSSCKNLTSVTLGESLVYIESNAFYSSGITSIVIPNKVIVLGENSFKLCENLTSVYIGSKVREIAHTAFNSTSKLNSIEVSPDNATFLSVDNCVIERETNGLVVGCNTSIIPNTVTIIDYYAFYGSGITSIEIPESVVDIRSQAFRLCANLERIICKGNTPLISSDTFRDIKTNGILEYPQGSDYSEWLSSNKYYLGYYGWTGVPY